MWVMTDPEVQLIRDLFDNRIAIASINSNVDAIKALLVAVATSQTAAAVEIDQIVHTVTSETDVVTATKVLVDQIVAKIAALGDSPPPGALAALTAQLKVSRDSLAVAVAANTPVGLPEPVGKHHF